MTEKCAELLPTSQTVDKVYPFLNEKMTENIQQVTLTNISFSETFHFVFGLGGLHGPPVVAFTSVAGHC